MSDKGHVKVKQKITAVVTKTMDSCKYSAFKPTDVFLKSSLRTTQKTTFCHGLYAQSHTHTLTLENG